MTKYRTAPSPGAWPFWPSKDPKDSDDRLRSALEDQPGFVYSGMVLPSDVDLWSNEDFQRFGSCWFIRIEVQAFWLPKPIPTHIQNYSTHIFKMNSPILIPYDVFWVHFEHVL
jgi:hypothetical protein